MGAGCEALFHWSPGKLETNLHDIVLQELCNGNPHTSGVINEFFMQLLDSLDF
jgi:hypothetical protein